MLQVAFKTEYYIVIANEIAIESVESNSETFYPAGITIKWMMIMASHIDLICFAFGNTVTSCQLHVTSHQ